jgi:hypothetical protein
MVVSGLPSSKADVQMSLLDFSNRPTAVIRGVVHERLQIAYSVGKLEKNGGLFFCGKPKYCQLSTLLNI